MQVLYAAGQFAARAARTSAHSAWVAGPKMSPGPLAGSTTLARTRWARGGMADTMDSKWALTGGTTVTTGK